MFNPLSWLKRVFSSRAVQTAKDFLVEHEEALDNAFSLVKQAEADFPQPKSGQAKWDFVMDAMRTVWPEIKPHIMAFLVSVAVGLLKGGR